VILVEPFKNLATDSRRWLRRLSHHWTNPGTGPVSHRFSREELERLFGQYGAVAVEETSNGRELIGVFDKGTLQNNAQRDSLNDRHETANVYKR